MMPTIKTITLEPSNLTIEKDLVHDFAWSHVKGECPPWLEHY